MSGEKKIPEWQPNTRYEVGDAVRVPRSGLAFVSMPEFAADAAKVLGGVPGCHVVDDGPDGVLVYIDGELRWSVSRDGWKQTCATFESRGAASE